MTPAAARVDLPTKLGRDLISLSPSQSPGLIREPSSKHYRLAPRHVAHVQGRRTGSERAVIVSYCRQDYAIRIRPYGMEAVGSLGLWWSETRL